MGKQKKQLHPADQERKKQKKKDLKRNKVLRKTQREVVMTSKKPEDILAEIHKINRLEIQGLTDDKHAVRKRILIAGHKAAIAKEKAGRETQKTLKDEPEVIIKGMNKIFRSIVNKVVPKDQDEVKLLEDNREEEEKLEDDNKEEDEAPPVEDKKQKSKSARSKFTDADLEAMVFDEALVATNMPEVLLEAPPGLNRPPGLRARSRGRASVAAALQGGPWMGNPPHHHAGSQQQLAAGVGGPLLPSPMGPARRTAVDPLDPEGPQSLEQLQQPPDPQQAAGQAVSQPSGEPQGLKKQSEGAVAGAAPIMVSAQPTGPVKPTLPQASVNLSFVPTSLLVRNRVRPTPVRRPRPKPKPAAVASEGRKRNKVASAPTPSAPSGDMFDMFMKEMEGIDVPDDA